MASASPPRRVVRSLWSFLRSNDLGTVLLLGLALLFVAGSLIWEWNHREYEGLRGDDLHFFFDRFRVLDLWFWLILAGCTLLGLSLAACAWDALARRRRAGMRGVREYGPILMHIGSGIALIAHATSGWGGGDATLRVGRHPIAFAGYQMHLVSVARSAWPDGTIRAEAARIEIRESDGTVAVRRAAHNAPARWRWGTEMLLLLRTEEVAEAAILSIDGVADTLAPGETRSLVDGGRILLERLHGPPQMRVPVARVTIAGGDRAGTHLLGLDVQGGPPDLFLTGIAASTAALVTHRRSPATVWFLVGAGLLAAGLALVSARFLHGRRPGAPIGAALDDGRLGRTRWI